VWSVAFLVGLLDRHVWSVPGAAWPCVDAKLLRTWCATSRRQETEEEKALRGEIERLKSLVEAGEGDTIVTEAGVAEGVEAAGKTVQAVMEETELQLLKLTARLDDELRFSRGPGRSEREF
jgi:hypothetical protein